MMTLPPRSDTHPRGALLFLSGMICFAVMGSLVKLLSPALPAAEIAFFRVTINLLLILPVMLWYRISLTGKQPRLLIRRSLAGCGALTLSFYAVTQIQLVDAAVLHKTSVFFTPLLAALIIRERVSSRTIALSVIGFIGAILIVKPSFNVINLGGLAGISAGFLTAIVMITLRELRDSDHFLTIVFSFCAISAIFLGVVFGSHFRMPDQSEWLILFALGVSGTLGQILFTGAYRFATASSLAPLSLIEVLMAGAFGFMFFKEIPDVLSFVGAALIIGAGLLLLMPRLKKSDLFLSKG